MQSNFARGTEVSADEGGVTPARGDIFLVVEANVSGAGWREGDIFVFEKDVDGRTAWAGADGRHINHTVYKLWPLACPLDLEGLRRWAEKQTGKRIHMSANISPDGFSVCLREIPCHDYIVRSAALRPATNEYARVIEAVREWVAERQKPKATLSFLAYRDGEVYLVTSDNQQIHIVAEQVDCWRKRDLGLSAMEARAAEEGMTLDEALDKAGRLDAAEAGGAKAGREETTSHGGDTGLGG